MILLSLFVPADSIVKAYAEDIVAWPAKEVRVKRLALLGLMTQVQRHIQAKCGTGRLRGMDSIAIQLCALAFLVWSPL